jgi:hypothetical protein
MIPRRTLPALAAIALLCAISARAQSRTVISVSEVESLYAAVNDPANAGALVVLGPGTFALTLRDPSGKARPHGGHLVLQPGMGLRGQNAYIDADGDGIWDARGTTTDGDLIFADPATETVIDAGKLPGNAGQIKGIIRLAEENSLERLTVRNNVKAAALIDVKTAGPLSRGAGMSATVRDCVVEVGQRGLQAANEQASNDGFRSRLVVERNVFRHMGPVVGGGFGWGIQFQQERGVRGARWDGLVRHNRCYDGMVGLFLETHSSDECEIDVLSQGNIYEANAIGVFIWGGADNTDDTCVVTEPVFVNGANGNATRFTSIGDAIWNNNDPQGVFFDAGGVVIYASLHSGNCCQDSGVPNLSSNDSVRAQLIGTRFVAGGGVLENRDENGNRRDLRAYGAIDDSSNGGTGCGNRVELLLRDATSDGAPGAFSSIDDQGVPAPCAPAPCACGAPVPCAPNEVVWIGSDVAVESANDDVAPIAPGRRIAEDDER